MKIFSKLGEYTPTSLGYVIILTESIKNNEALVKQLWG